MKQIPKRVLAIGLSAALLVPGGALAAAGGDPALSRSAFARVLWEEAGRPSAPAGEFFSDVAPGDANYTAILWCAQSGIAAGNDKGLFLPQTPVTREQAAVMLNHLAVHNGDGIIAAADLSGCSDAGTVSAWAVEDVQWAVAKTILPLENGLLDPQGTLTAAEAQAMAQRYAATAQHAHTLGLSGVENARQLGGYVTRDGRVVKDNVLLRTGKLSGATEADLALLAGLNLTQIVDLRTTAEIREGPDPVLDGVVNTQINILGDDSSATSAVTGIYGSDPVQAIIAIVQSGQFGNDMYLSFLESENGLAGYRAFFQKLLGQKEGEALLWHCTGGKDRAGTAAVLLLSALGVDRETVLQDFMLTNDFNAQKIAYMAQAAQAKGADAATVAGVKNLTGVNYDAMAAMLDAIDSKYGSMHAFLTAEDGMALTEAQLAQLQALYLQ